MVEMTLLKWLSEVLKRIMDKYPYIEISSVTGRDIAMDRNGNLAKTNSFFKALTQGSEFKAHSALSALDTYLANNQSEEFMPTHSNSNIPVSDKDSLVFFNTRPDRAKQTALKFLRWNIVILTSLFDFTALGDYDLKIFL